MGKNSRLVLKCLSLCNKVDVFVIRDRWVKTADLCLNLYLCVIKYYLPCLSVCLSSSSSFGLGDRKQAFGLFMFLLLICSRRKLLTLHVNEILLCEGVFIKVSGSMHE